jgi:MFS family permease
MPIAGAVFSFTTIALPFLLRQEGIPVDQIGRIVSEALLVLPFSFVAAPLTDMIFPRRIWVVLCNLIGAALLVVAMLLPRPSALSWLPLILAMGNLVTNLAMTSAMGLMAAVLPDEVRGRGAGWFQMGNMGSTPLLGGICLLISAHLARVPAALALGLISFLPALSAFFVSEPPRALRPSRFMFLGIGKECMSLLCQRRAWLGVLLFAAPFGAGALGSLLSGLGADYHVRPELVQGIVGIPGGVVAAVLGAYIGGVCSDRLSRRLAYLGTGVLLGLTALVLALGPLTPATYVVGGLLYECAMSMAFAAGTALALEITEAAPHTAAFRMALFTACFNVPVSCMPAIDGWGSRWGVRGVAGVDAGLSFASVAVCGLVALAFWPASRPAPVGDADAVSESAA